MRFHRTFTCELMLLFLTKQKMIIHGKATSSDWNQVIYIISLFWYWNQILMITENCIEYQCRHSCIKMLCSTHLSSVNVSVYVTVHVWVSVCVCVLEKGTLTDAGAEVSILSVSPVVVGVAVVAAHRLQLDLLDLHGLCDGCVGSCCRGRCQAWREEADETERLQTCRTVCWCWATAPARPFQGPAFSESSKQMELT